MAAKTPRMAACCWRSLYQIPVLPKRCFSTTLSRKRHGAVPQLTVSDTAPEQLVELLGKIRTNIFLPAHLNRPQKKLVYKTKLQRILETDPVVVTLGDEDFTLQPLGHMKDEPGAWQSMGRAMHLMDNSKENWRGSFVGLLQGFKTAGQRWKPWQWESIAKAAAQRGMVGVVIDAAQRSSRTGLVLTDVRFVRQALWGCRFIALGLDGDVETLSGPDADVENATSVPWEEERTRQALRFAEKLAQLLDMPDHCGDVRFVGPKMDPRTQPDCIGVLLELAAARAEKHLNGVDEQRKVLSLTERLLANLQTGLDQGLDQEEQQAIDAGRTTIAADYELMRWVPVARGLETAMRVLQDNMPYPEHANAQLQRLEGLLDKHVKTIKDDATSDSKLRIGLDWQKES